MCQSVSHLLFLTLILIQIWESLELGMGLANSITISNNSDIRSSKTLPKIRRSILFRLYSRSLEGLRRVGSETCIQIRTTHCRITNLTTIDYWSCNYQQLHTSIHNSTWQEGAVEATEEAIFDSRLDLAQ